MDNTHQEINELTRFEVDSKRIARLERKQRPKTKVQRLKGFFYVFLAIGLLCQFLSALLTSSGVLYHVSEKLNGNGFIVSVTSICILLLLEGSKRFTLDSFHQQRLDDGEVQKITYVGILLFGSISILSTYCYTGFAVEFFAAAPKLVSIDSINTHYNDMLSLDTSVLNAELVSHRATAEDVKKRSSWKGRISRDDRPAYMAAVTAAKDVQIKLSEVSILRQNQKTEAVQEANKENNKIMKAHLAFCHSFGSSLAIVSIFLELLFFLVFWFCENYKRLEVSEATAIRKLKDKQTETTTETNKGIKRVNTTDNKDNTPRTVITAFATNKTSSSRTCSNCGTDITNKRSDAKFCSTKCRTTHHKNKLK